ncbi:MAG: DUF929 family protein, partial [Streptosporangiaceae bacterium]
LATGSIIVVAAVVLTFVIIKLNNKPSGTSAQGLSNGPVGTSLTSVVHNVTTVPVSTSDAVGDGGGSVTAKPTSIKGTALTANGKPEMLYIGAEFCPYCAAERWAMIVALSRFGTFTGLSTVHSAVANGAGTAEPDPDTPTFTFVHAKYTSKYLTFTPVEETTNIPDTTTGTYTPLQTPTAAQQALVTKYAGAQGSIPFIDFGNKYMIEGASYDPGTLGQGKISWATIASDLHNPNSSVAKAVLGVANYITAAICGITGNQPASACTSTVTSLQSQI